ncbi:Ankyrin repeat domain-containing protein 27 [Balamuthia mandrillaris]
MHHQNAQEEEDLTANPFFRFLKRKYARYYALVERNCYLLCVPQQVSLRGLNNLDEEFVKTHILKPSPLFKEQYVTLNGKEISLENNSLSTKSGFEDQRTVRILFEEMFYNNQSQSFQVLCLESPLIGPLYTSVTSFCEVPFPKERTLSESILFLRSFPENEIVLNKIEEHIEQFNKTYVLVKNYEQHAVKKIQGIFDYALEALLCANGTFRRFHNMNNEQCLNELKEMIEIFVSNGLHAKLWKNIRNNFKQEDSELYGIIAPLEKIRQSDLGVREELQCSMVEPTRQFKQLEALTTPLEKLYCLKKTNDLIMKTVQAAVSPNSDEIVTTDDLIPFLAYIIVLSKCKHLQSQLFYMENFTFSSLKSELGFNLVSFQAAVQYLKSEKFSIVASSPPTSKHSHSLPFSFRPSQSFEIMSSEQPALLAQEPSAFKSSSPSSSSSSNVSSPKTPTSPASPFHDPLSTSASLHSTIGVHSLDSFPVRRSSSPSYSSSSSSSSSSSPSFSPSQQPQPQRSSSFFSRRKSEAFTASSASSSSNVGRSSSLSRARSGSILKMLVGGNLDDEPPQQQPQPQQHLSPLQYQQRRREEQKDRRKTLATALSPRQAFSPSSPSLFSTAPPPPPEVITLDGRAGFGLGGNDDDGLGDFLGQLSRAKDDTLYSTSSYRH